MQKVSAMRKDIDVRREWIVEQLGLGVSRLSLCRDLGCKYETLAARLKKWGCTDKNQSGKGVARPSKRVDVREYLKLDGLPIHSAKLRLKLIAAGLKENKCEECGLETWRGMPLPLELDHLNGNRFDNRLENLKIKCPNCHSQADTNAGKNRGAYTRRAEEAAKLNVIC